MKGNKKILVVAVLLLLIAVSYSTYAIYKSEATASSSVQTAAWVVEVNDQALTQATHTFTLGTINWATPTVSKVAGKIAPGDHGTVTIEIDATGTEVDVDYTVSIDTTAFDNDQFEVVAATGSAAPLTGTIAYSDASKVKTVTLDIKWNAVDTAAANTDDLGDAGSAALAIPVTVTVVQNPNPATP